jgi:hypothetical protein
MSMTLGVRTKTEPGRNVDLGRRSANRSQGIPGTFFGKAEALDVDCQLRHLNLLTSIQIQIAIVHELQTRCE